MKKLYQPCKISLRKTSFKILSEGSLQLHQIRIPYYHLLSHNKYIENKSEQNFSKLGRKLGPSEISNMMKFCCERPNGSENIAEKQGAWSLWKDLYTHRPRGICRTHFTCLCVGTTVQCEQHSQRRHHNKFDEASVQRPDHKTEKLHSRVHTAYEVGQRPLDFHREPDCHMISVILIPSKISRSQHHRDRRHRATQQNSHWHVALDYSLYLHREPRDHMFSVSSSFSAEPTSEPHSLRHHHRDQRTETPQ